MRKVDREDSINSSQKNIKKTGPLSGCIPDVHPQQKLYEFDELTLDSCFDSGNMGYASKYEDYHVPFYQKFM